MSAALPSHAAIIDVTCSSSRMFVYKWHPGRLLGQDHKIELAFSSTNEIDPENGLPLSTQVNDTLHAGYSFLNAQNKTSIPLYPVISCTDVVQQRVILDAIHDAMSCLSVFDSGLPRTKSRFVSEQIKGLYSWIALNFGRHAKHEVRGLIEVNDDSMTVVYALPELHSSGIRVSLQSGQHNVYSQTWPHLGVQSARQHFNALFSSEGETSDTTGITRDPCRPMGLEGYVRGGKHSMVGGGEFARCLNITRQVLRYVGDSNTVGISSYHSISSSSPRFYGTSTLWRNYHFFAQLGGYDVTTYNRDAYQTTVSNYCSSSWEDIQWNARPRRGADASGAMEIDAEDRCFEAAWGLTLLHDHEYGFGLDMLSPEWEGVLEFPTSIVGNPQFSWTIGAALLIARNGDMDLRQPDIGQTVPLPPAEAIFIANSVSSYNSAPNKASAFPCAHFNVRILLPSEPDRVVLSLLFLVIAFCSIYRIRQSYPVIQRLRKDVKTVESKC